MTSLKQIKSKVICYLVGAGPGDDRLLTIRAKEILESAEVVIYDHLIPEMSLELVPEKSKKIDAGKVRGNKMDQTRINQILVEECKRLESIPTKNQHHCVVRLKGGDPFIFARSSDELNVLKKNNISFELVPGISSFYAVPEYAGIPLTMRKIGRSFSVITGHFLTEEEKNQAIISYSDTVVYLMGIKNLEKIISCNLAVGKPPLTPVAIIQDGTLGRQKTVLTNLKEAVHSRDFHRISHPGIVIIGEVAKLHNDYAWFEKKSLFGQKIGILRKKKELPELNRLLQDRGAEVISIPIMSCVPVFHHHQELITCLKNQSSRYLLFTSSYAVTCFSEMILSNGYDLRILGGMKIIAVGEGTEQTLKKYHLRADYLPDLPSQNGIWNLIQEQGLNDIVFPKALVVRKYLENQMKENGIRFQSFVLYENRELPITKEIDLINSLDFLLLTSSRVVEFLLRKPQSKKIAWPQTISLGEVTHKTLAARFKSFPELKLKSSIATTPSFIALVEKIEQILQKNK